MKFKRIFLVVAVIGLCACAPEPGSDVWCADMAEKPKGDWTMKEAVEYAKSCIVKTDGD